MSQLSAHLPSLLHVAAGGVLAEPGARVVADAGANVIDLDFAPDGTLYVLQHATGATFFTGPGEVISVAPDGTRSVVVSGLTRPTSLVVGPDGALYISNRGTSIAIGEVLRIIL